MNVGSMGWYTTISYISSSFLLSRTVLDQSGEFDVIEVTGIVTILFFENCIDLFLGE